MKIALLLLLIIGIISVECDFIDTHFHGKFEHIQNFFARAPSDDQCTKINNKNGFTLNITQSTAFSKGPVYPNNITKPGIFLGQSPPLQSFSYAVASDNRILAIGGRWVGVHNVVQRCNNSTPPVDFYPENQNHVLWVIDKLRDRSYALPIPQNSSLYTTLSLINTQSIQDDKYLYIFGGYGWSNELGLDIAWPIISIINIETAVNFIMNGDWTSFSTLSVAQFSTGYAQVTGGELMYDAANQIFYVVVGQNFVGNYHGADFSSYTSQFRGLKLSFSQANNLLPINFTGINFVAAIPADPVQIDSSQMNTFGWEYELHRRDLNVVPTIVSNGNQFTPGFGLFGGVFDPLTNSNLYTRPVYWNYDTNSSPVLSGFHQLFNSYDCATASLFNSITNQTQIIFFGGVSAFVTGDVGITQYTSMFQVPWTNKVSVLTTSLTNSAVGTTFQLEICNSNPAFERIKTWGTEARFLPQFGNLPEVKLNGVVVDDVLEISTLTPRVPYILGSIYGGIESDISDPDCTFASHKFYDVYITMN